MPPAPPSIFTVGFSLVDLTSGGVTTNDEIDYAKLKGCTFVRLVFGWEQLQPVLLGPLNSGVLTEITNVVAYCQTIGLQCWLDCHNYGRFTPVGSPTQWAFGGGTLPTDSGVLTTAHFNSLWTQIAAAMAPYIGTVKYDLINEPHDLVGDGPTWTTFAESCRAAIRSIDTVTEIIINGYHFSNTYNWAGFNPDIHTITDAPYNNITFSGHMYPDPDDSGGGNGYDADHCIAIGDLLDPGAPLDTNTGVKRLTPFFQWATQHGKRINIGESGIAATFGVPDNLFWFTQGKKTIDFCQANNVPFCAWAGGKLWGAYAYSLQPGAWLSNASIVDSEQWALLGQYTGVQSPVYFLSGPSRGTTGSPSSNFTLSYRGWLPAGAIITPSDTLLDGTSASGSFTPASLTLAAATYNPTGVFTYTASATDTIVISVTNNKGLTDPAPVGYATIADDFISAPNTSSVVGLRRLIAYYIGPAIRLILPSDGVTQRDFFFNPRGDLPRQAIQDWAGSRLVKIARIYSQNGNAAGDYIPILASQFYTPSLSNPPSLTLVNAAGYPEVTVASGQWMGTQSNSSGKGLITLIARANITTGLVLSQDNFTYQFRLGGIFEVGPNGGGGSVSFGALSGYELLGGTYSSLYSTNNIKGFVNGSNIGSASVAGFTFAPASSDTFINAFRFGGQDLSGAWQWEVIDFDELSTTLMGTIATHDATYYSTSLPDSLTGVAPTITGAGARGCIVSKTSKPFLGVTISDTNGGGATDSVTITLTGSSGGALTGTGLSGSGPYTIASASAASVTTTLQGLTFTPSGTVGQTETLTVLVNSSAGSSVTSSATIVTVQAVAAAETPFAAPVGTFTPINLKGVNISDADVNYPANGVSGRFAYIYPQAEELSYFSGKGMGLIRVGVVAQRFQPVSYGPLDPAAFIRSDGFVGRADEQAANAWAAAGTQTNLTALKAVLDQAFSLGMYVLIDLHNGGQMFDTQNNISRIPGTDTEFFPILTDWWVRMVTKFKNYPNARWGLFNEPESGTAAQWQAGAASVASAIAAVTTTQAIHFQGVDFDKAGSWTSTGNAAAWASYTPPAGISKVMELHQYLNAADDGAHSDVVVGSGSTYLDRSPGGLATTWARAHGWSLFLGETGWSANDSQPSGGVPSTEGGAIMSYMTTNNDVWIGWSYWLGGSVAFENNPAASIFTVVPTGYPSGPFTDTNQMSILVANL